MRTRLTVFQKFFCYEPLEDISASSCDWGVLEEEGLKKVEVMEKILASYEKIPKVPQVKNTRK